MNTASSLGESGSRDLPPQQILQGERKSQTPQAERPQAPWKSPGLPRITPEFIQDPKEPPVVVVTSDLPQVRENASGSEPTSRRLDEVQTPTPPVPGPPRAPEPPAVSMPGRPRLEVVLNMSPQKPLPGQKVWSDAASNDEPTTAKPKGKPGRKKRPREDALAAASSPQQAKPAIPSQTAAKKPRGRPKGWRPGMPSTKTGLPTASAHKYLDKDGNRIQAASTAAPKPTGLKRRGRPPREPSPTPRGVWETMRAPKYVTFQCEWVGCKAELQNVDTLRRHVQKIHERTDPLVCRWGSCGRRSEEESIKFGQADELQYHVDQKHLEPFVWFVGDGARNGRPAHRSEEPDANDIPAYLFGSDGSQVTPSVSEQEIEDFLTWRENRRRLKELLLQRDANAPLEEDDDDDEQRELDEAIAASLAE